MYWKMKSDDVKDANLSQVEYARHYDVVSLLSCTPPTALDPTQYRRRNQSLKQESDDR